MPDRRKDNHLPWIDALRFIAAFLVMFCHARHDFFLRYDLLDASQKGAGAFLFYTIGRLGPEAVFVFFVISGFLVGGIGLERIKNDSFRLTDYVINRTVRIGLPLIGAICLYGIVTFFTEAEWSWLTAIGNLLSLQEVCVEPLVPPFWSLSYEVWFYIVLFAIALTFSKHRMWGLSLFVICCLVFTQLKPIYLLYWIMGALAWLTRPKKSNKLVLIASFIGVGLCLVLSQMTMESKAIPLGLSLGHEAVTVLLCFAFCILVQQIVILPPPYKYTGFNLSYNIEKAFSHLADFSYTLYLTHRIIFLVIFKYIYNKGEATFCLPDMLDFSLILIMTLAGSYIVYLLSEKHTKRVKSWVKARLRSLPHE